MKCDTFAETFPNSVPPPLFYVMALRIHSQVRGGALDFTVRGIITGHLDVIGRTKPVSLNLEGLPWPDLAGHRLSFHRGEHVDDLPAGEGFHSVQEGSAGDMTASHKVKIPDRPIEEWVRLPHDERPHTWGNCLYLEWFSMRNGRVVLESTDFTLLIDPVAAWAMEPDDRPGGPPLPFDFPDDATSLEDYLPPEDDSQRSAAEIEADREAARMDLLLDRIGARMDREGDDAKLDQIMEEERERLRIELGEPEPEPLTPEEEDERDRWIEEMNAIAREAENAMDEDDEDDVDHPLVTRTSDYALALWRELVGDIRHRTELPHEHPFVAITDGVTFAGVKLAGALQSSMRRSEWPPDPLYAGDSLVRLKKARGHLHDALGGLKAAESDGLLRGPRLDGIDREVRAILAEVERLISEIREVL